jgi:hypothetical protein
LRVGFLDRQLDEYEPDLSVASLDHLVRGGQQRFRDGEAERLCGLEPRTVLLSERTE